MPMILDAPIDTTPVPTKTLKNASTLQQAPKVAPAPQKIEVAAPKTQETTNTSSVPQYTPMKLSGILGQYDSYKVTPSMGTEFRDVNLVDWITGPDSDAHIRDLAILISRRGVVSFRGQTQMTDELQKELTRRLGQFGGAPAGHGLYEHPMNMVRGTERDMQTLDIKVQKKVHFSNVKTAKLQSAVPEWHTDMSGEACPASYTMLRMTDVPECGNDTMFLDGYELYERLSPPWQRFCESLNGYQYIGGLRKAMEKELNNPLLNLGPRGAPDNIGLLTRQTHPVVRTNPVTGWKSLYTAGLFYDGIEGFTEIENKEFYEKIMNLCTRNHDLQLRYRWNTPGDMAIWDNRSTMHAATIDYELDTQIFGARLGRRTLFAGERPFYDPNSISRCDEVGNGFA